MSKQDEWRALADSLLPSTSYAEHRAALRDAADRLDAVQAWADEWAADPESWGDNDRDYRNELRDRAAILTTPTDQEASK